MTAAVGAWILAWGDTIAKALEEDRQWGTTTMRPRCSPDCTASLPQRLRVLAGELHERLSARWPETVIADYPALAQPGAARVQVPGFWQPEVCRSAGSDG